MTNSEIEYLIIDLYGTSTGGTGGFGHIVFEDDNVETQTVKNDKISRFLSIYEVF